MLVSPIGQTPIVKRLLLGCVPIYAKDKKNLNEYRSKDLFASNTCVLRNYVSGQIFITYKNVALKTAMSMPVEIEYTELEMLLTEHTVHFRLHSCRFKILLLMSRSFFSKEDCLSNNIPRQRSRFGVNIFVTCDKCHILDFVDYTRVNSDNNVSGL